MRRRIGPLTMTTGPTGMVVASSPCALNSSVHAASTAASTTGRYSGLQPASTALIATFSTVHGTRSGGTTATTSCGSRRVPSSIACTRRSVGGTTGRPSVQPRSCMRLDLVLERGELDAPGAQPRAAEAHRQLRRARRVDGERAAARPPLGQIGGEIAPRRSAPPTRRDASRPRAASRRRSRPAAASARSRCRAATTSRSAVSSRTSHAGRKRRVVLAEHGERGARGELREHRRDQLAGRAVALDEGDDAVGERGGLRAGHGASLRQARENGERSSEAERCVSRRVAMLTPGTTAAIGVGRT